MRFRLSISNIFPSFPDATLLSLSLSTFSSNFQLHKQFHFQLQLQLQLHFHFYGQLHLLSIMA